MTQFRYPSPGLDDLFSGVSQPVKNLEVLRHLLQGAITHEFAAIAPCMTALWSIQQVESDVAHYIHQQVFSKLAQAYQMANLLLAVGGVPKFSGVHAPVYPCYLPAGEVGHQVKLVLGGADHHFYRDILPVLAVASQAQAPAPGASIETVGQFYKVIEDGLVQLEEQAQLQGETIFKTTPGYKQAARMGYGVEGYTLLQVTNLMQGHQVLRQLIGQTEQSMPPLPFSLVALGGEQAALPAVQPIQQAAPGDACWAAVAQTTAQLFDGYYSELMRVLERSFEKDERMHQRYLEMAKPLMRDVLPALAKALMQLPAAVATSELAVPQWRYSLATLAQTQQQAEQLQQQLNMLEAGPALGVENLNQVLSQIGAQMAALD